MIGKGRTVAALVAGAVIYVCTLFRFLSYSARNHLSANSYLFFALLMLAAGAAVALGAERRYRLAWLALCGVFAAHACVVVADWMQDPTNHNLLPFEFVMLGIVASPVFLGAACSRLLDRLAKR